MYISSLTLTGFRNYKHEKFEFSPHTNFIYGDNAQGKTNVLEAVYLFAQGRSHRTKNDKELIGFNEQTAALEAVFYDKHRDYTAVIRFNRGGKKSIKINNVPITKLSMLMNYLNVVIFSPEDLNLIKGSPGTRRRFTDASVSQLYPAYLTSLINYHKALSQKNSLLKLLKKQGRVYDISLSVWNEQLAEEGEKIIKYRREFSELINKFASKIQSEISGEELCIEYVPGIHPHEGESFFDYLERHQRREIEFSASLFGIQRDDFEITVNGRSAKLFASQGQQRTAALSMKIAQADYIEIIKEEYPVLLLDDIMSELDIHRREYLSEKIRDKQVLITSTDTDLIPGATDTRLFKIHRGHIEEQQ